MNIQATKEELINFILHLQNKKALKEIKKVISQLEKEEVVNDAVSDNNRFSKEESELIMKINEGLPEELHVRYRELLQKSVEEKLTEPERKELLELSSKFEEKTASRLKYVYELSLLWNTTVDDIMERLGLTPPPIIHA